MLEELYENQMMDAHDDEGINIDIEELEKLLDKDKKTEKFLKQKRCYIAS